MDAPLISTGGLIFMFVYLTALIIIGILGNRASAENSLSDFYLSGRNMGLFILFLTLYATQYSGNTLIGFAGKAYRQGFYALVTVTFMVSVIGAYFIYAPKLFRLSRKFKFITIGDFIQHRYKSTRLTMIISIICIVALGNYILTNLKAIGLIVEISSGGGRNAFIWGIIFLSLIMVIYETLGGLRSVAWTDAIQGILLLVGCVAIFAAMLWQYDGLTTAADYIIEHKYEIWKPPNAQDNRLWISTILLAFFAISIYPHAIQRIYASKSERTLKRALQFMVFMPFVTTFFMVIVGVISISQFPDLHRLKSDQVSIVMLQDLAQKIPGFQIIVVVFITAVTAAIMSTVDSALLAISSLFTQDLYRNLRPNTSQKHLTNMGKAFSWLFIAFMAYLAITISETIYRLFEIKLEILCQVAPAIFLGLYFKSINSRAIITGILVGLTITLIPLFGFNTSLGLVERPWGIHAGIWGLGFNCLTVFLITLFGPIFNAKKEA